jgi:aspartyl-tRNA(Asn)/glutamyl-tRNA(Gln) amidotransferase subunit C
MPDALTIAEVERIAALARLALTGEEKLLYAAQLTRILDYARQVSELDTRGVIPTAGLGESAAVERPDVPHQPLGPAALSNAPDSAAGLFRVPRVMGDA